MPHAISPLRFTAAVFAAAALYGAPANADPFSFLQPPQGDSPALTTVATPPTVDDGDSVDVVPANLRRQIVAYATREAPGTIVIDTPHTYLYYVLGDNKAIRYGIGVGREGFTWSGVKAIERKAEWPDWNPPAEMIARQPYLPRFMAGGPGNPLGARAMYIGGTMFRIHGTNAPATIGHQVSSGCIRMLNEDVIDLYERVQVGSKVVVLPQTHPETTARAPAASMVNAYAPAVSSPAAMAWQTIRPSGLY